MYRFERSMVRNRRLAAKLCAGAATSALAALAASSALADAAASVSELVVTAAGREQQVREAPASISVISREELERLPYREVTDALMEIPGVTITPGEGNSRDISVRGMAPQYTLILVDGKRLSSRESRTNGGNISEGGLLPPLEAIERIEVVRGPMSSLYGSDAMGGVVNIITRRIGERWRGSMRVNGALQAVDGFGEAADGNFYVSGPVVGDRLGLQVQGSLNRRAEDKIIGGTPERQDESIAAKAGLELNEDHDLLLEAGYYRQKVTTTAGKTVEVTDAAPEGMPSTQTQKRYVYSVSHTGRWGWGTSESYLQQENSEGIESQKEIKNTTAQTIFVAPLGAHTLSLGAFYRFEDLKDLTGNRLNGSTRAGAEREQWAVFVEDEWKILEPLAITAGIRLDDDEQYGQNWSPRLYAVWKLNEAFTLKGGISSGFRAPNLRQTLADWGQTSRGGTIYGNPDLEAETSLTYEAALLYGSDRLMASLTAYQTDFKDKITRVTCVEAGAWCVDEPLSSIGRPPTTYVNVDEARIRGMEVSADFRVSATVDVNASFTLTDSEQLTGVNAGAALNDTPKQQGSASLNWRPTPKLSSYVRAIYRGEEAVTEAQISGENIVASSYTTVDIGGSYRFDNGLTLHGGVQNLFDKRLTYDEYAYVIDGARVWLGLAARF